MNSEELRIYTALTHPTAKEDYRIVENGTKLYTLVNCGLVFFQGEDLDKMTPTALYYWYQEQLMKYHESIWS